MSVRQEGPTKHDGRLSHSRFALKYLHDKVWNKRVDKVAHAAVDLVWEAHLLSRLSHDNIIQIHGMTCRDVVFNHNESFFLVLDRLDETLYDRLEQLKVYKTDCEDVLDRLESTAIGLVRGMEYLHNHSIMFRDLTPRNIGFDARGTLKLFDFGLACYSTEKRRTVVGTFRHVAPEVILKKGYDLSRDVYSFGIVLYQMYSLELKFVPQLSRKQDFVECAMKRGGRPSLSKACPSRRVQRLIKECWHPDPTRRPTFTTIQRCLDKIFASSVRQCVRRECSVEYDC